jgi:acylphosphatase
MPSGDRARVRVRVSGRVQGVFFRAETRDRAHSLGLDGWVRNAPDGSVEAVFEGDAERVESMVAWCRRGPRGAQVDNVEIAQEEPRDEQGFSVRF